MARTRKIEIVELVVGQTQEDLAAIQVHIRGRRPDLDLCLAARASIAKPDFAPCAELSASTQLHPIERLLVARDVVAGIVEGVDWPARVGDASGDKVP